MVNIYKQELTVLQQEILRLLFVKVGSSLNARRIAQYLHVSPPAVAKALPLLEEKNVIKIKQDTESKRWAIELNRDNHQIMQLKRVDNLKQFYESGCADFLEQEYAGATISIFGSYAQGGDTMRSDIDIAVIGRKEKKIDMSKYGALLEREININYYDSFEKIHKNLKESICNGILLAGGITL